MSSQYEIGPGDNVRLGTQALAGVTRVYMQNLDERYGGEAEIRPVGAEVTGIAGAVLGADYYRRETVRLEAQQFWQRNFKYAGAIMEVANIGHTRLKVWTDL